MDNFSNVAFRDMTPAQSAAFELQWVAARAVDLVAECGVDPVAAAVLAPLDFETYLNQEGHTGRDERIAARVSP